MSAPGACRPRFYAGCEQTPPAICKDFDELFCGISAFGLWKVLRACLTRPEDICSKAGVHATLGAGQSRASGG